MTQEDYLHKLYAQKYPYLEGFRKSIKQLLRYGLSDDDCIKGIESACDFFEIPMPALIADLTSHPNGQTMFLYNPQNEMFLPRKTKCSKKQNEMSSF